MDGGDNAVAAPRAAGPSATFSIRPPEPFDFSKPQDWAKWIRRFERFRLASNLQENSDENQVNTFIYCMGDEADDILRGLPLADADKTKYDAVKAGFEAHFVGRRNVIYERARFNMRKQEENETVDSFVTALYALAEHCNYLALHDELIRDRLVVGLADKRLSERMQLDHELTLEKAIAMARQSEEVKRQQAALRSVTDTVAADAGSVDRVYKGKYNVGRPQKGNGPKQKSHIVHSSKMNSNQCHKCGSSPAHAKRDCPANDVKCHSCGKKGHYKRVCTSSKTVREVCEGDPIFLGSITGTGEPWMVNLNIRHKCVPFKIDTGADVTVIPVEVFEEIFNKDLPTLKDATRPLLGPGQVPLDVVGVTSLLLKRGEKQSEEDVYIIRNLHTALLGRPAIAKLELVARLDNIDMEILKTSYPKLCSGLGEVRQPYVIRLKPGASPFSLKTPRRIPLPLMSKVKEELSRMEILGVISRVEEPTDWCAGMVVVPKKSGAVRICVDLSKLNESVRREKYILPSVEQTLGMLAGAQIFSKLDANMGFWQIPLSEDSARYTTFITPFGRYFFKRLPFGISSAPEHFQNRMATEVTEGLEGTVCHIDDVLVWGRTREEHDTRLHAVLRKMQKAGMTLNVEKCELSKQTVHFLGHIISADGISPDPMKTAAIRDMTEPSNVSQLRSFLGMVNQLGKFIPRLADKDKALRDLLSKKNCWIWGIEQANAFQALKDVLSSPPVLAIYDANRDCKVSADASSYGLGAVLLQRWPEGWKPIAYASRSLTQTEQRYAQVEKEALGLTWACERFKDFVIGKHFTLETDHKPLLSLLGSQALDALPPRIQRFKMRLMRYSYSIVHVPGKDLWVADTLSRAPVKQCELHEEREFWEDTNIYVDAIMGNLPASTTYLGQLREDLKNDKVCSSVMKLCVEGWTEHSRRDPILKRYWAERALLTVQDDLLLRGTRLVIPAAMRNGVLSKLHEGHLGLVKCRERARQSVWWPGLSNQLKELVLNCRTCLKERLNPKEPLMPTQFPDRPWQRLGADLFMLGTKTYLLVVDYYSRYVEIAQLSPSRSTDVIVHMKSIFARHGVPETLITDNGPQFSGHSFASFAASYGFVHVTSSPKFPQSNGEAERAVKTIKALFKKADDPYLALLAYRATPLQNGYSPAQLLMGRRLRTTVPTLSSLLDPALPDTDAIFRKEKERKSADAERFNKHHRARKLSTLQPGEEVWVSDAKESGTIVASHFAPRSYLVNTQHGTVRRNRYHLVPMQASAKDDKNDTQDQSSDTITESHPVTQESEEQDIPDVVSTPRTRCGRRIVKPARLNL